VSLRARKGDRWFLGSDLHTEIPVPAGVYLNERAVWDAALKAMAADDPRRPRLEREYAELYGEKRP
jgi:hypothetical protein